MRLHLVRVAFTLAVLIVRSVADDATEAYSLLDPNMLCSTLLVQDVTSATECFSSAMPFVSLDSINTMVIPGLPFKGCVYNTVANMVFFGTGQGGVATDTYRYLCKGIATTTTVTTTTATTAITATETHTVVPYSLLAPDTSCASFLLPDITNEDECFQTAVNMVSLSGRTTFAIPGMPFYGCVYNVEANVVMFNGYGDGANAITSTNFQQICRGIATTTTVTTTTATIGPTVTETQTTVPYTLLDPDTSCASFLLHDVTDENECFKTALNSVSLSGKPTLAIPGMPFYGCVYNMDANVVMFNGYGDGSNAITATNFQQICRGIATTTTHTTTETETQTGTSMTHTATTKTTSTKTTTTKGDYSMLGVNMLCSTALIPDITTKEECFNVAALSVGLGNHQKLELVGMPFKGCVFNTNANFVLFSSGGFGEVESPSLRPICKGTAATDTTTRTSITTEVAQSYSVLPVDTNCANPASEVSSEEECFNSASEHVGLGTKYKLKLTGFHLFAGCVYGPSMGYVIWNEGGPSGVTSPDFQQICKGAPNIITQTTTYFLV